MVPKDQFVDVEGCVQHDHQVDVRPGHLDLISCAAIALGAFFYLPHMRGARAITYTPPRGPLFTSTGGGFSHFQKGTRRTHFRATPLGGGSKKTVRKKKLSSQPSKLQPSVTKRCHSRPDTRPDHFSSPAHLHLSIPEYASPGRPKSRGLDRKLRFGSVSRTPANRSLFWCVRSAT